jgi:HSP20 family protein
VGHRLTFRTPDSNGTGSPGADRGAEHSSVRGKQALQHVLQRWANNRRWAPAIDLVETDDHFVLRADLPGLEEKDVTVRVGDSVLTISGERRFGHEDHGYHRVERGFGSFSRALTLPEGVDADAIQASFDRGVLEVRVPKPQERKPRTISIDVGSGNGQKTIEDKASAQA